MTIRAGVLGLQGSSEPHLERLAELGLTPVEVRQKRHLTGLTHLILPGGESTTIRHLLDLFGLTPELVARQRGGEICLFGTCAGAILLARDDGERPSRLALLDAEVERNAYGRQVDSFTREVQLALGTRDVPLPLAGSGEPPFHCVFIRAPRFKAVGAGVKVLGAIEGEPILVTAPGLLAGTFHPELTGDLRVHRHFLEMEPAARSAPVAV
jgi:5'-phosphate synthase pdxT subunit